MSRFVVLITGGVVAVAALTAAAVAVNCRPAPATRRALQLEVRVVPPLEPSQRPFAARVGDRIAIDAAGADRVWVYLDRSTLVARCPSPDPVDDDCAHTAGGIVMSFRVDTSARYLVLAVSGAAELAPTGEFDRDVLAVRSRGASLELQAILATSSR